MKHYFLTVVNKSIQVSFENEGESEAKKSFLNQFASYIVPGVASPDLTVLVQRVYGHTFMRRGKQYFVSFYHEKNKRVFVFPDNQGDSLNQLFYQIIINRLIIMQKLILVHASACLIRNRAVLFVGESGSGKSTIVTLLKKTYRPLCDDMAILRKKNNSLFLYQVPYEEKNNYRKDNTPYPVSHIYVLKKDGRVQIRSLPELGNYDHLVHVCGNMSVSSNRKSTAEFVFTMHNRIRELSFPLNETTRLAETLGHYETKQTNAFS